MRAAPVLQACALDIGHGKRRVGQDISLAMAAGEVLCLFGPNGSGKTTLFRTLLGLMAPLAGDVRLLGEPVAAWSRSAFARHVGYVPQAHAGIFPFSVEDVVLMGRAARIDRFATPSPHDRDYAQHCLNTLGIAHLRQPVYTAISGGERQLVLIARALAQTATPAKLAALYGVRESAVASCLAAVTLFISWEKMPQAPCGN